MTNTNTNTTTTTATATATTIMTNKNGGRETMENRNVLIEMVINGQNGYIRDRKHEKVAVWELKQAIIDNFEKDNHSPIAYAVGNWMVCAGYSIMNRTDIELYAITERVVAFCVNGVHITAKNSNKDARADVFSSSRVKAACYRAIECDFSVNVRKEENKPIVKQAKAKKTSAKEARIVRIMEKFGCDRATAEEMAV